RRKSDRRIALSHIRYVALALLSFCWHATVYGSGFSVRTESATYIVAAGIPPIIATTGARGGHGYCPFPGPNEARPDPPPSPPACAARLASPPISAPAPPPITAPPTTRSCRPFAHPASAKTIAITTTVLRICFDLRQTTQPTSQA